MAGLASINIKFSADLKQFSTKMQSATRSMKKMGKQMQSIGAGLSVGVTAPFVAFGAIALKNWDKQEQAIAQVNAGLQSTGGLVGYTSEELQKMASELQNNSLFGDEEILENATAQLLTFTNIAGDQFARTQQAAIDLSTRLGGDLKSASIQLGKALNDPVANLSALSRSGIQFTKDQKETINSLVSTNRLADAQTIILDELAKQYGGAGEAAAKAGLGGFKQLQNTIGDVTEEFGSIIAEAILPFVGKIKEVVASFQALSPETKKNIVIFGSFAASLGPLLVALGFLMTTVIPGLITAFGGLKIALIALQGGFIKFTAIIAANPFGALAVAVTAIASYFLFFNNETDKTIKKQTLLSQINDTAAKSIANEKAKLAELLFIAKDESIVKSARIKAVKELNNLSPKYLGNLTLEKINTDSARVAIELYNNELLKTAKYKAAQTKLQEIASKIIDLELAKEKQSVAFAKAKLAEEKLNGLTVAQKNKLLEITNKNQELGNILSNTELKTLKDQEAQLLKIIAANQTISKVKKETTPEVSKGIKKQTAISDGLKPLGVSLDLANPLEQEAEKLNTVLGGMKSGFIDFSLQTSEIISQTASNALAGFGSMIAGLANGSLTMGDVAGGLMKTIGDLAIQLGKAAIEIGVGMLAIQAAFTNPFTAIAAGIALVAIGSLISTSASITSGEGSYAGAFADGGVIGGNSFSGDKLFARVNSGEMILNQRQQGVLGGLIGGGSQEVNVVLQPSIDFVGDKFRVMLNRVDKRKNRTT
ncbi:phage tail tape measure protein [Polaribacter haliotis]|uniref:Phage tail tape measure protein n=1 Tax=Polaribacter haliotis TaxID=1888915 RepID=A0A7L8AF71_9FLAO|nr:phage tail length tape measure family protein [Polaribacter haliotis]QOD60658.1 phage tail tape measure protein [Polaribacter haliotis]